MEIKYPFLTQKIEIIIEDNSKTFILLRYLVIICLLSIHFPFNKLITYLFYQKILNYAYDEGKLNGICNEYDILEISYRNYPLDLYYIFINLNPSIISEYLLKIA